MATAKEKKEARKIIPKAKIDNTKPIYRAICHTKCFWMGTLWSEGDGYEGPVKPPKHFSKDGTSPNEDPAIRSAGDDPRSNVEMLGILKKKFGVELGPDENGRPPTRSKIYQVLKDRETVAAGGGGIKVK
jgi:hypothetical protein